jgi:hypothetical protein
MPTRPYRSRGRHPQTAEACSSFFNRTPLLEENGSPSSYEIWPTPCVFWRVHHRPHCALEVQSNLKSSFSQSPQTETPRHRRPFAAGERIPPASPLHSTSYRWLFSREHTLDRDAAHANICKTAHVAASIRDQFHHPLKAAHTEHVLVPKLLRWSAREPVYL